MAQVSCSHQSQQNLKTLSALAMNEPLGSNHAPCTTSGQANTYATKNTIHVPAECNVRKQTNNQHQSAVDTQGQDAMPKSEHSLDLFSSLTIHGLASSIDGVGKRPVTVKRALSFPARLKRVTDTKEWKWKYDMSSRPLPDAGFHLELQVKDILGEGRSGRVFSTEIIKVRSEDGNQCSTTSTVISNLPPLCIKVPYPIHCRGVAREAWFYEKLDDTGLQSVIATRSYGFFEADLNQQGVGIDYWKDKMDESYSDYLEGGDVLPDDGFDDIHLQDDHKSSHALSPWYKYKAPKSNSNLAILLLEQQGAALKEEEYESDAKDIADVLRDLSAACIAHFDIRYHNMVRAAPSTLICPKHQRIHRWCIIDFELSGMYTATEYKYVSAQRRAMSVWHNGYKYIAAESD